MKRRFLHGLLALPLAALIAGCSQVPLPSIGSILGSDTVPATPRLEHAVDLLEAGDEVDARAELKALVRHTPHSKSAQFLLAQMDTPIGKLYPAENFTVRIPRDASLEALARDYLGNSLAFYGLARYNGIEVPSKVARGQIISIPKTPEALAALNRLTQAPTSTALIAPAPTAPVPTAKPPVNNHVLAVEFYRRGLVAFQRQDLDAAIVNYDRALSLDREIGRAHV